MRFTFSFLLLQLIVLTACLERENATELLRNGQENSEFSLSHGMIVLGKRLDNPYSTENMRKAYSSVYPTKSRDAVETTHYYVRFLPESDKDMAILASMDLDLYDHPLDYEILVDGDYYHDPSVGQGNITWQYTVVEKDFSFPDITYEIIQECCITDPNIETRSDGTDWGAIERAAYIQTGNAGMLMADTKAARVYPQGKFTFSDEFYENGAKQGVAGVKVVCNAFVKIARAYTDEEGYFKMNKTFSSSSLRYSIVYDNVKGFDIGFNFVLIPASVAGLGKRPAEWVELDFNRTRDPKTWRRSVVNNAMYDYYKRTEADTSAVAPPPSGYRIWIIESMEDGYSLMMHQGAVWEGSFISKAFPKAVPLLKMFSPDALIGMKGIDSAADLYALCYHEAAHASHYRIAGNAFWNSYAASIAANYLRGTGRYGKGTLDLDGYTGVAEMWAFYYSSLLYRERYGFDMAFPEGLWFKPQFLKDIDAHGVGSNSIYLLLTDEVTSIPLLGESLIEYYEHLRPGVRDIFESYFGPGTKADDDDIADDGKDDAEDNTGRDDMEDDTDSKWDFSDTKYPR